MAESCPISYETVCAKTARVNGALTALSILIFLFTPFKAVILVLAGDLFIRGFSNPSYSIFSYASRKILGILNVAPAMTNAGPKIFAAKVGFVFSFLIALLHFFNIPAASTVLAAMLGFFAFLEAAFGFCVACQLYPYMPGCVK